MLKIVAIGCIVLCCVAIAYALMVYFESRNYGRPDKQKSGRR